MNGYSELASIMGKYSEMGILRRFGTLNAQNLLYLQAELTELEIGLKKAAQDDIDHGNHGDVRRRLFAQNWTLLSRPIGDGDETQWAKILQIRTKLREYNECLFYQVKLSKLDRPDQNNLKEFRRLLEDNWPLVGPDRLAWDDLNETDLVVIRRPGSRDLFSTLFFQTWVPFFHEIVGKYFKKPVTEAPASGLCYYSDAHLRRIVDVLGVVISSLLPVLCIVILYLISSVPKRLGIVAGFTAAFSLCLALMTEARRVEIFAATTAFAAVQVVFVGTNGLSPI